MAEVELHGKVAAGRVAIVDDADLPLVSGYRWSVQERVRPNGTISGPYARCWGWRDGRKVIIYMHQVILGQIRVDHVNRYGLDCTRKNLRPASNSQNGANRGKTASRTSSRYIGVSWWAAGGCWKAQINHLGKNHHLGYFDDEELAAWTRDQAAIRIFGEFASLNFSQGRRG